MKLLDFVIIYYLLYYNIYTVILHSLCHVVAIPTLDSFSRRYKLQYTERCTSRRYRLPATVLTASSFNSESYDLLYIPIPVQYAYA